MVNLHGSNLPEIRLYKENSLDITDESDFIEECRMLVRSVVITNNLMLRFSSFTRLIRVTAYCFWLLGARRAGFLTREEHTSYTFRRLRIAQQLEFSKECLILSKMVQMLPKSTFLALQPFISGDGLI